MRDFMRNSLAGKAVLRRAMAISVIAAPLFAGYAAVAQDKDLNQFFTDPILGEKGEAAANAPDTVLELSQDQALWTALAFEDNEKLRNILARNVDPNKPEELTLMTPLMAAETVPLVETLLAAGANPNARDRIGRTPLHYAVKMREGVKIVPVLIRAGADINLRTEDSQRITPLFSAIENYIEDKNRAAAAYIIRTLVHYGSDINAADAHGKTVLAHAALNNQPDLIQLLRELGADPNRPLLDGRTPLDYARAAKAQDAIQALANGPAKVLPAN